MNDAPVPAEQRRVLEFARSEVFERTFREGMALVEETAAYLEGPGHAAAKRLSRPAALAYASESMRLTTRLMQVASWLLVQRAVREREIGLAEAGSEKYRLNGRIDGPGAPFAGASELPAALTALAAKAGALYERVVRLDETIYGARADVAANPVTDQMALLNAAFGEKR
jgi:regulator of CtrA degradation